jgi:hypothetical protein
MVVARSGRNFLYILDRDGIFSMFTHTPGAPGGGRKQFPKDDRHVALVRKITDISDHVYLAEFGEEMDLFGVMYAAEEGILSMFPGDDRDADGSIEFEIPAAGSDNID